MGRCNADNLQSQGVFCQSHRPQSPIRNLRRCAWYYLSSASHVSSNNSITDYYEHVPKDFHIIGFDGAGVVEKVGPECQFFKEGDEVSWVGATTEQGSYAEYQLVSEFSCAHKPKNFDFVDAASYGLTFVTAYQSLWQRLEVKNEENAGILIVRELSRTIENELD